MLIIGDNNQIVNKTLRENLVFVVERDRKTLIQPSPILQDCVADRYLFLLIKRYNTPAAGQELCKE